VLYRTSGLSGGRAKEKNGARDSLVKKKKGKKKQRSRTLTDFNPVLSKAQQLGFKNYGKRTKIVSPRGPPQQKRVGGPAGGMFQLRTRINFGFDQRGCQRARE